MVHFLSARIPAVVWSGLLAFGLTVLAGGVWTVLLISNVATSPAIPWAVVVMALLLWLTHSVLLRYWRWAVAGGLGWLCIGLFAALVRLPSDELRCTFLAVGQTVLLNNLLPQMQALNPNLTISDLLRAGAIELKQLVTNADVSEVLLAYARSLNAAFHVAVAMAVAAVLMAFGVEWKSVKRRESKNGEKVKESNSSDELL